MSFQTEQKRAGGFKVIGSAEGPQSDIGKVRFTIRYLRDLLKKSRHHGECLNAAFAQAKLRISDAFSFEDLVVGKM